MMFLDFFWQKGTWSGSFYSFDTDILPKVAIAEQDPPKISFIQLHYTYSSFWVWIVKS